MVGTTANGSGGGNSDLPLAGLRVLNLGWYWVCATMSHLLADMGAEVIKIDSRQRLETLRGIPPFMDGIEDPDHNLWLHNLLRNTQSITVNLETEEGRERLRDLVRTVDVVTENWTPGTVAKLGIDYASLRPYRPDLIMVSPSAAGQWGPYRRINTYGQVISTLAGLDAVQGYAGERPSNFGMSIIDPFAGIMACYAVLAALRRRNETGQGCHVDFSQWEMSTATLGPLFLDYQWNGRLHGPEGNRDALCVPNNVYPSVGDDRWVSISVYEEKEWGGLLRALGRPRWGRDPRFADKYRRKRNEEALDERIAAWTKRRTHYEATERLQAEGVAAFPVMGSRETYSDPHWRARDSWLQVDHQLGPEWIYGVHWKLSGTPGSVRTTTPLLGEHNRRVFRDLMGTEADEFRRLEEERVIY